MTLTEREKAILTGLVYEEIKLQRKHGQSDWSEYSTELFDLYRKLPMEEKA